MNEISLREYNLIIKKTYSDDSECIGKPKNILNYFRKILIFRVSLFRIHSRKKIVLYTKLTVKTNINTFKVTIVT